MIVNIIANCTKTLCYKDCPYYHELYPRGPQTNINITHVHTNVSYAPPAHNHHLYSRRPRKT